MKNFDDILPELKNVTTGQKVKAYREAFKISQNKMCELIGLSQHNLSAIENDRRKMGIKTAVKISAIFNVDPLDLLYPDGVENSTEWIEARKKLSS